MNFKQYEPIAKLLMESSIMYMSEQYYENSLCATSLRSNKSIVKLLMARMASGKGTSRTNMTQNISLNSVSWSLVRYMYIYCFVTTVIATEVSMPRWPKWYLNGGKKGKKPSWDQH